MGASRDLGAELIDVDFSSRQDAGDIADDTGVVGTDELEMQSAGLGDVTLTTRLHDNL